MTPARQEVDPDYEFGDARDKIRDQARDNNLGFAIYTWDDSADQFDDTDPFWLMLQMRNGRNQRAVLVTAERANALVETNFHEWVFLADYQGFVDLSDGSIECLLDSKTEGRGASAILSLPGAEVIESRYKASSTEQNDEDDPFDVKTVRMADGSLANISDNWRILLTEKEAPLEVELSPSSHNLTAILTGYARMKFQASIKIRFAKKSTHDVALDTLEQFASALFFELDVRFGKLFSLSRHPRRPTGGIRRWRSEPGEPPIRLPHQKYAREAVTLYAYGRAARATPLMQYFAYYQAVEFFFPSFFNAELIGRIRNELRDPRFNTEEDRQLQRIVRIAAQSSTGSSSEREQLRATLRTAVDETQLREFIEATKGMKEFLAAKEHIRGVPNISLKSNSNVMEQVADRIYRLRCRIVHSKSDTDGVDADVLLPFSAESSRLEHDLCLLHFICQKVIISGSRGRLWGI